jgi:hypothetical protein
MEDVMPRKRKSDDTPSTESTTVTPDAPAAEAATAVAEPPASTPVEPEAQPPVAENPGGRSFAERVGQKQRPAIPDPFGIAGDYLAGVRLFESRRDGVVAIKFGDGSSNDKPSLPVIGKMKEAGYRWSPVDRVWTHPVADRATRIEAERLYQEVRQMIREEKGIEPDKEVPF